MNRSARFLFYLIAFIYFTPQVYATHSLGGEITWTCLGNGQFKFRMRYLRDCNGIQGPSSVSLNTTVPGIPSISLILIQQHDISADGFGSDGITSCPNCSNGNVNNPVPGLVEEFIYESFPVTLLGAPPAGTGWMFSFGECCRSNSIDNLSPSVVTGLGLRAIMYPFNGATVNTCFDSSPHFVESPVPAFCNGYQISYNQTVIDPDRDSLVYSWTAPYDDSFLNITFSPGYSVSSQLPGPTQNPLNTGVSMDPNTGYTEFTSFTGGRFATCIKVTSYKQGQKVSEVFRESLVYLLNNCPPISGGGSNMAPVVSAPDMSQLPGIPTMYSDTVYAGDTVQFNLQFNDMDFFTNGTGQNITISGSGDIFGSNYTNPSQGCTQPPCAVFSSALPYVTPIAGNLQFNWVTSENHLVTPGNLYFNNRYVFSIKATDNYCPANGISTSTFSILILPREPLLPPVMRCASVNPNGGVSLFWTESPSIDSLNLFRAYKIYASTILNGPYQLIDSISSGINATSGTITAAVIDSLLGADANQQQLFFKISVHTLGASILNTQYSNTLSTIKGEISFGSSGQAILNWNAPSNPPLGSNSGYYNIFREYPQGSWFFLDSTMSLSYSDYSIATLCNDSITYRIQLSDTTGCTMISTLFGAISNDSVAMAAISPANPGFCPNGTVILSAYSGQSYLWNTGATTQTISVNIPGTYSVTVTTPGGCTGQGITSVTTFQAPTPVITGSASFCQGSSTMLNGGPGYTAYSWSNGTSVQTTNVNTGGIYTVTVTNTNGCTGSDSIIAIMNPLPNPAAVANGSTSFCIGDSVQLNVPGGYVSYQWYRFNFPVIPYVFQPSYNAKTQGYYKCRVIDVNGCINYSNSIAISYPCIPVENEIEKEGGEQFSHKPVLYPNPSHSDFYLNGTELQIKQLYITDLSGKSVQANLSIEDDQQIKISGLDAGIYILKIAIPNRTEFYKLIKIQ